MASIGRVFEMLLAVVVSASSCARKVASPAIDNLTQ
jgi:hypothetical protein